MKFIQTLYADKSKDPFKQTFGWAAPEYHLMSWALSCLQLHKTYNKVELYANSSAAKLLIDILELPYSSVHLTHDSLKLANENLWALPKILTYSLQKDPFLHLDGDVFLFDRFTNLLLNSELIVQNVEEATDYYKSTQKELMKYFTYFPNCVEKDFKGNIPIKAVNAGILGGSNIGFIKEYTDLAFKYINKNVCHLPSINVDRFNVFFEQHLFYSLAKEKEIPIGLLINATIKDNEYLHLGDFHEVPCKRNYLHLLGQFKKDEHTCRLMATKLRQLYPEYYYRIISLFKSKSIPVSTSLYNNYKFKTVSNYTQFATKAKESFSNDSTVENKKFLNDITIEKEQIKTLVFLKNIVSEIKDYNGFSKAEIEDDYADFSKNLLKVLKQNYKFEEEYLYGRDLEAVNWFCELFGNETDIINRVIEKCDEASIITSGFDWAGLLNQHNRVGVKYYELLELKPGEFYNLVIPEIFGDCFSLHDIDEMEKIMLEHLHKPLSIKNLLGLLLDYVEEDIITNHYEEYQVLFIVMLKQLVLKKAIKPLKKQSAFN